MTRHYSLLAVWGAVLSTLLAALKIWELWRSRRRIEFGYKFAGLAKEGNEVVIRNLSGTPIIITYWELVWLKRTGPGLKKREMKKILPDSDFSDLHVAPYSIGKLVFADENHFDWSEKSRAGAAIYLRVQIAGESRPRLARIYE